jgi:hypothetical protein
LRKHKVPRPLLTRRRTTMTTIPSQQEKHEHGHIIDIHGHVIDTLMLVAMSRHVARAQLLLSPVPPDLLALLTQHRMGWQAENGPAIPASTAACSIHSAARHAARTTHHACTNARTWHTQPNTAQEHRGTHTARHGHEHSLHHGMKTRMERTDAGLLLTRLATAIITHHPNRRIEESQIARSLARSQQFGHQVDSTSPEPAQPSIHASIHPCTKLRQEASRHSAVHEHTAQHSTARVLTRATMQHEHAHDHGHS